jgi:SRSO17 transposase
VPLEEPRRRRTYWTFTKRACLRHIGDVTIILSKKRRNDGPNATKILVTNLPDVTARQVVDVYRRRWAVEQWLKDVKQLLGLGQYQNRSYGAAVTHLHLVAFAYALLTHRRMARTGAPCQRTRDKAAGISTAAVQNQLRTLLWEDLITYLKEERPGQPVIQELERLRVA